MPLAFFTIPCLVVYHALSSNSLLAYLTEMAGNTSDLSRLVCVEKILRGGKRAALSNIKNSGNGRFVTFAVNTAAKQQLPSKHYEI